MRRNRFLISNMDVTHISHHKTRPVVFEYSHQHTLSVRHFPQSHPFLGSSKSPLPGRQVRGREGDGQIDRQDDGGGGGVFRVVVVVWLWLWWW